MNQFFHLFSICTGFDLRNIGTKLLIGSSIGGGEDYHKKSQKKKRILYRQRANKRH